MTKTTNLPKPPTKFWRMWHKKDDGWCHAWDIEDSHYRTWKANKGPLSSSAVFLPDGTNPRIATQVKCGTCGSTRLTPTEMKQEPMRR